MLNCFIETILIRHSNYCRGLNHTVRMPVIVKDFVWKQSDEAVSIRVPLKGIHSSKVDVITSEKYLKIHYPPFIFEVFLFAAIKDEESECILTETEAHVKLVKTEKSLWPSLECEIDKKDRLAEKQKIIDDIQVRTRKALDAKISEKIELNRFTVHEAIEVSTKQRQLIDDLRNRERENAMKDFEDWKRTQEPGIKIREINEDEDNLEDDANFKESILSKKESSASKDLRNQVFSKRSNRVKIVELPDEETKSEIKNETKIKNLSKCDEEAGVDMNISKNAKAEPKKSEFYKKVMSDIATRVIPAPRETQVLNVTFTERVFPTPSRESCVRDEQEWLKNVNEARKASGFISEDLRPEEQDPDWCKNKGDEFFKMGNYLGAVNAYSHGIKLCPKMHSLYSNRAAAQLALGNYRRCVEDCSTALELLVPICSGNLESRVKCIARRAAALTRLGMLSKAIDEQKAAVKLKPGDNKLKEDLKEMEKAWQQDPDSE